MRDKGCIALELTKNLLQPFFFNYYFFFLSSVTVTSYIIDVCYNLKKKNGTKHMARLG